MDTISNTSNEILGVSPDTLAGLPQSEIIAIIRLVQAGLSATEPGMTEDEIQAAAEQIFADAN